MIDNKDYNYTLVVAGENFQILHHDTMRNLTYRHGLNVRNTCKFSFGNDDGAYGKVT